MLEHKEEWIVVNRGQQHTKVTIALRVVAKLVNLELWALVCRTKCPDTTLLGESYRKPSSLKLGLQMPTTSLWGQPGVNPFWMLTMQTISSKYWRGQMPRGNPALSENMFQKPVWNKDNIKLKIWRLKLADRTRKILWDVL